MSEVVKDITADKPTLTARLDGSVTVMPGGGNTKVTITLTDESGQPQTVFSEKQPDGTWTVTTGGQTGVIVNPTTGTVTLPADKVQDGSTVTATVTDEIGNQSSSSVVAQPNATTRVTPLSNRDTAADKPSLIARPDGSVVATPGSDNVKVILTFIDESGQSRRVVAEKQADGKWVITSGAQEGITLDGAIGSLTISANQVQDGSTVTATGVDLYGHEASISVRAKALLPRQSQSTAKTLPNTGSDATDTSSLGLAMLMGAAALVGRKAKKSRED